MTTWARQKKLYTARLPTTLAPYLQEEQFPFRYSHWIEPSLERIPILGESQRDHRREQSCDDSVVLELKIQFEAKQNHVKTVPHQDYRTRTFFKSRDFHPSKIKHHWIRDFSCKAKRSGWRSKTRQGESPKQYRFWLVSRRAHLYFSRGVWVSKVDGHPSSSNVPQWNSAKPKNTLYWFLYWFFI